MTLLPNSARINIFISSPSGVEAEKEIAIETIRAFSDEEEARNEPGVNVRSWPQTIAAGNAPYGQSVINRQVADLDILVCIVGARMGTRTPRANSGTEEEFDRAIEAINLGRGVQILLFFSNLSTPLQNIDPYQLFLIRAFREKASRLGILYQFYSSHEEFRHLVSISLREAYGYVRCSRDKSRFRPQATPFETAPAVMLPQDVDVVLSDSTAAQRASYHLIPLAPYRHCDIRVSGTLATASPYFRFGFKYYDAREPVLSAGSVQTFGQNILFHIGKNVESPTWFGTPYRAGNRAGDNTPIPDTEGISTAPFEIRITSDETVTFHLNGKPIYEQHFPVDGLANLAIMAWGDEHHFTCAVRGLQVNIQTISTP